MIDQVQWYWANSIKIGRNLFQSAQQNLWVLVLRMLKKFHQNITKAQPFRLDFGRERLKLWWLISVKMSSWMASFDKLFVFNYSLFLPLSISFMVKLKRLDSFFALFIRFISNFVPSNVRSFFHLFPILLLRFSCIQ